MKIRLTKEAMAKAVKAMKQEYCGKVYVADKYLTKAECDKILSELSRRLWLLSGKVTYNGVLDELMIKRGMSHNAMFNKIDKICEYYV